MIRKTIFKFLKYKFLCYAFDFRYYILQKKILAQFLNTDNILVVQQLGGFR